MAPLEPRYWNKPFNATTRLFVLHLLVPRRVEEAVKAGDGVRVHLADGIDMGCCV